MNCKKLLFLIWLYGIHFSTAQNVQVENISDPKSFPEIKLRVQTNNPHFWQADDFKVLENNKTIPFELSQHPIGLSQNQQQHLLLLVENLNQPERNKVFRQLVISFINSVTSDRQKINIAVFDRVRDKGTQPIRYLLPEYTHDKNLLLQTAENLKPINDVWGNNESSDLYHALYQSVTDISLLKNNYTYIVLFSTGFNNKWSSHTSSESVKALAREKECKIYSVQYYIQGFEHHKLTDIVQSTFGEEMVAKDLSELQDYSSQLSQKISENIGAEYFIQYQSSLSKKNNSVPVELFIDNKPYALVIKTPVNYWLIAGYIVLGLLLISALLYYFVKKQKKLKAEISQFDAQLQLKTKEQEHLKQQIQDSDFKLNNLIRLASDLPESQPVQSAEELALLKQMKSLGKLPELYFEKLQKRIVINRPEFSIGRADTNDLIIQSAEVSRTHALISFKNNKYFISDSNSAMGVWVNHQKVNQIELRHGDQLKIGNLTLTFVF